MRTLANRSRLKRALSTLGVLGLFTASAGCEHLTKPKIGIQGVAPTSIASLSQSRLVVDSAQVTVGNQVTLTFYLRDEGGNKIASSDAEVQLTADGDSAAGVIGAVTNHRDGSYTATFRGLSENTFATLHATIDGQEISSALPTVSVLPGDYSLSRSLLFSNSETVLGGASLTVYLSVRNYLGVSMGHGGLSVAVSALGGTSSPSSVTDNHDGTYQITFSGVRGDSSLTIHATIAGLPVVSSPIVAISNPVVDDLWTFNTGTSGLFNFNTGFIQFISGAAELVGTPFQFHDLDSSGFSAGSMIGVDFGTLSDGSTQGLKLQASGTPTNNSELDASWAPQYASLVGYWKMNGNWNDSKGANHGTAMNSATFSSASKLGSGAGSFDGVDDYVTCGHDASLSLSESFTLSAWVNSSDTSKDTEMILTKSDGALGTSYELRFAGTSRSPQLAAYFGGNFLFVSSTKQLENNAWYFITATYDGSSAKLYLNGVLDAEISATGPLNASSADCILGARSANGTYPFVGKLDEAAIWNTALSASEIKTIYDRQSSTYAGTFTSQVIDAGSKSGWTSLAWIPTLPFFKELPDAACPGATCTHLHSETQDASTGYSSVIPNLMTGVAGLWHFNETTLQSLGNGYDFKDDSGNGVDLVQRNGLIPGKEGKFSHSIYSTGGDPNVSVPRVDFPSSFNPWDNDFSFSFWANTEDCDPLQSSVFAHEVYLVNGFRLFIRPDPGGARSPCRWVFGSSQSGGSVGAAAPNTSPLNQWQHVGLTFHRTGTTTGTANLYLDGQLVATSSGDLIVPGGGGTLGPPGGSYGFHGRIDELGIWARALGPDEIKQLYERGASRIKYQIRSCATNPCTTENWQGPDGTNQSYFSELNNNSVALDGSGDVNPNLPSLLFSTFLTPPTGNSYFQYRAILETDDSTLSNGPELKSVAVNSIHYPADLSTDLSPSNTLVSSHGFTLYELQSAVETLGPSACAGGVAYNLALSSTGPWKYWNGTTWTTANGSSGQANSLTELNANSNAALKGFGSSVGHATVYLKAFLKSSGAEPCQLSLLQLSGIR